MALERVYLLRRRAASMMCWLLSARVCGGLRLIGVGFQRRDDLLQVAQDLPVHLHHSCLAAGLGGGDDLQQLLALFAVLRQELGGGDEHRAGQAGFSELRLATELRQVERSICNALEWEVVSVVLRLQPLLLHEERACESRFSDPLVT